MLACHLKLDGLLLLFCAYRTIKPLKKSGKFRLIQQPLSALWTSMDIHSTVPASTRTAWEPKSDALSTGGREFPCNSGYALF